MKQKYKTDTGALDDTATDITKYTWDNRNRMTKLTHQAAYGDDPDMVIVYNYDADDRMVEEKETTGGDLYERMIWDGTDLLEVLDGSDNVTQRYLNAAAVDQVLAVEEVGGSDPGVNWLLADAQGTVRDVARGIHSGGGSGSETTSLVDHVILDAYGDQTTAQTATDPQLQSPVGFRGMLIDPLAGFFPARDSGGNDSATGLYYSPNSGWYDSVLETFVTAAQQGYNSGVTNPYEYSGDDPTTTNVSMRSQPMNPGGAVGLMDGTEVSGGTSGGTPVYMAQSLELTPLALYGQGYQTLGLTPSMLDAAGGIVLCAEPIAPMQIQGFRGFTLPKDDEYYYNRYKSETPPPDFRPSPDTRRAVTGESGIVCGPPIAPGQWPSAKPLTPKQLAECWKYVRNKKEVKEFLRQQENKRAAQSKSRLLPDAEGLNGWNRIHFDDDWTLWEADGERGPAPNPKNYVPFDPRPIPPGFGSYGRDLNTPNRVYENAPPQEAVPTAPGD